MDVKKFEDLDESEIEALKEQMRQEEEAKRLREFYNKQNGITERTLLNG